MNRGGGCSVGLPSKLREAGGPGQDLVGFDTPREGGMCGACWSNCSPTGDGRARDVLGPEIPLYPETSPSPACCLCQSDSSKSRCKHQRKQILRYRNAFISPVGWK